MALEDPHISEKDCHLLARTSAQEEEGKLVAVKSVLYGCHTLDLGRCFDRKKLREKVNDLLLPLLHTRQPVRSTAEHSDVMELLYESYIEQILTGNKVNTPIAKIQSGATYKFADVSANERNALFIVCSLNTVVCARLVELTRRIETSEQANILAIYFNRYAQYGTNVLLDRIQAIEEVIIRSTEAKESLDGVISRIAESSLDDTCSGRVFKTVRADDNSFWNEFAESLVDPKNNRPELRVGERKAYTYRLQNGCYEVVSTDKGKRAPLHANKEDYTRHQSTTYSNFGVGYNPPPFFFRSSGTGDLLVGVSFSVDDCIFQRIMTYDGGTVVRPYDFDTEEEASSAYRKAIRNDLLHTSIGSLQKKHLEGGINKHNEVMAGFRWNRNKSSHITVFSDNLENRLLARVRAADLRKRLGVHFQSDDIEVPISIYPDFSEYNSVAQLADTDSEIGRAHV